MRHVFVTGGTGYIGQPLIAALVLRGHAVRALAREGSEHRLPPGCTPILGNALDPATFADQIAPADTLVHLVGVAHPNPSKAADFQRVDLASLRASAGAAKLAGVRHFVYLSVAQPAPVMKAYVATRQEGEATLVASKIPATMLRPWYVLGEGHRWPIVLLPFYWLLGMTPGARETARRLGLVHHRDMIAALVHAVEHPATQLEIIDVPRIREIGASYRAKELATSLSSATIDPP